MGYYTSDAAELARANAGLPPDEHVGSIYVLDAREQAAQDRRDRDEAVTRRVRARAQAVQRWREGRASSADLALLDGGEG